MLTSPQGPQDGELLKALSSSKHPLTEAIQQPVLRDRKAQFAVLTAQNGRSVELVYDLLSGEEIKARDADAPKK